MSLFLSRSFVSGYENRAALLICWLLAELVTAFPPFVPASSGTAGGIYLFSSSFAVIVERVTISAFCKGSNF